MRAREFISEQRANLPPEERDPMHNTYMLPGIRNNDAYKTMRLSVAIARARADVAGYGADMPEWSEQGALGPYAIVSVIGDDGKKLIDQGLKMTGVDGGKVLVTNNVSDEPDFVGTIEKEFRDFGGIRKRI